MRSLLRPAIAMAEFIDPSIKAAESPMAAPPSTKVQNAGDKTMTIAPVAAIAPPSITVRAMPIRAITSPDTAERATAPTVPASPTTPRSSSGTWKLCRTEGHAVPNIPSGSPRAMKAYIARASTDLRRCAVASSTGLRAGRAV